DDVEGGRLARAVRPDQAGDLAFLDVEGDAVEGDDASEPQRDVAYLEERHREDPKRALRRSAICECRLPIAQTIEDVRLEGREVSPSRRTNRTIHTSRP